MKLASNQAFILAHAVALLGATAVYIGTYYTAYYCGFLAYVLINQSRDLRKAGV